MSASATAGNKHPERIKAEIRQRYGTIQELARIAKVDPSTLRAALRRPVPKGNRVIARHLDTTVHKLWPNWFDEYGNRSFSCSPTSPKGNQGRRRLDSQKGVAA